VVVAEKDRYGIPIKMICCSKCGLIRSDKVFDEKSNELFYTHYYRPLYTSLRPDESFFYSQYKRGQVFLKLIKKHLNFSEIDHVVEIGCGAGGILFPFKETGKNVQGVDFEEDYITFGQKKGLNLRKGSDELLEDESVDLLILSHVMEH
jgi:tRNA/tmRNA/rRNA uracil-C5-methylase (TrmA/RlmC/RlmD family)